jgi:hypothetical protein
MFMCRSLAGERRSSLSAAVPSPRPPAPECRSARASLRRAVVPQVLGALLALAAATSFANEPQPAATARGSERPSLRALALDQPIVVDGRLDDAAWTQAEVGSGFVQREPRDGEAASEPTEISVAFTRTTLYFAVRALDSDPGAVIAKEMEKDGDLQQDDSILIVLDTFRDGRNSYGFSTNPNGARADALVTDEGRDVNRQWDGIWAASARRTATGWVTEIAIPFSTLRFDRSLDAWGLNVERRIRRKNEETYWAAMPRETGVYGSSAAYRVSLAGQLHGLRGLERSRQLDVKPYLLGSSGSGTLSQPDADPSSGSWSSDAEFGLDAKWGVTRSMALDLTYNTDFAEVEVDDLRVNLTRFSLFFPEKRQFFLENAGIFDFGPPRRVPWQSTLLEVFFSRQIGLDAGDTVPIEGGGRLTGRAGGWNLGFLGVGTEEVDEDGRFTPRTGFGVARVKRNLGARSTVGAIVTLRDEHALGTRSLYGVDFEYKPTQRWRADGYWSRSHSPHAPGDGDDASWSLGVEYKGPSLQTSYDRVVSEELFDPAVGFMVRQNFTLDSPRLLWTPVIQRHGIRSWYLEAELQRFERSSDGLLETQNLEITPLGMELESGDFWFLSRVFNKERIFVPFEIYPGVVIPPGLYDFEQSTALIETDGSRPLSTDVYVSEGGFYDGDSLYASVDLALRANRRVRAYAAWDRNDVDLPQGSFTIDLYGPGLDLAFTPDLRINSIVQYNDSSGDLGVNVRFHWIYRPGADLFVVYNENWTAPDLGARRSLGRQLIVKVNYLWQR